MLTFNTFDEVLTHIRALPGYVPSLRPTDLITQEAYGGNSFQGRYWEYAQNTSDAFYKLRRCLIVEKTDSEGVLSYILSLPLISETPEGLPKSVSTYSGPDLYYPWMESIYGTIPRTGVGCDPVNANGEIVSENIAVYYRKSFIRVIEQETGFQNVVACWSRCNEGDFVNVYVDVPGYFVGAPVDWYTVAQFCKNLTIFGDNPMGTTYPPDSSPSVSWMPVGSRIRVDFYKLKEDSPEYKLKTLETEENTPSKRGPFIDIDILTLRKRS